MTYIAIRLLTMTGLAWQMRVPALEAIQAKQARFQDKQRSEPPNVDNAPLDANVDQDKAPALQTQIR